MEYKAFATLLQHQRRHCSLCYFIHSASSHWDLYLYAIQAHMYLTHQLFRFVWCKVYLLNYFELGSGKSTITRSLFAMQLQLHLIGYFATVRPKNIAWSCWQTVAYIPWWCSSEYGGVMQILNVYVELQRSRPF